MIGNRKAVYHINSLRKFYETDDANEGTLNMMIVDEVDADELKQLWEEPCNNATDAATRGQTDKTDGGDIFNIGRQLTDKQQQTLRALIAEFPYVFTDKPGMTDV